VFDAVHLKNFYKSLFRGHFYFSHIAPSCSVGSWWAVFADTEKYYRSAINQEGFLSFSASAPFHAVDAWNGAGR
jgi:hypothetical protein